jgi:hypothetical protein
VLSIVLRDESTKNTSKSTFGGVVYKEMSGDGPSGLFILAARAGIVGKIARVNCCRVESPAIRVVCAAWTSPIRSTACRQPTKWFALGVF